MAGTAREIAQALVGGSLEEALERAFVGVLGWERAESAIAKKGDTALTIRDYADKGISARGRGDVIELLLLRDAIVHRLPIDRVHPAQSALLRLALLANNGRVREGKDESLERCFDARSMAVDFLAEYKSLFEKYKGAIKTDKGTPLAVSTAEVVLNRFMMRVLLVAFLQTKGWLEFQGRRDYLQALYQDWAANPGGRLFQQRLALVFFNALDESRGEARKLLEPQIGRVPFINGGLFSPEQYEAEFEASKSFAVLPDGLFEELFASEGLLARYNFTAVESAPDEVVVAVTPEAMGAVLGAFLGRDDSPVYEDTASHRRSVRRLIAAQLGAPPSLDVPTERSVLAEWREGVRGIHVYDGDCGSGTYLVAALEELSDLVVLLEDGDRGTIKRRVATENIRGLDRNELAVQVARFRLALAFVAGDGEARPLPDLRQIIKKGGALVASRSLPPEGSQVEYKASFEWDKRRGQKSADMRFGSLKTIAAFLNSEGGTLYLGVDDRGEPVGLGDDFAQIEDDAVHDVFEGRLREFMKNSLDPLPLSSVDVSFEEMLGKAVCLVKVARCEGVTYLNYKDQSGQPVESVFVRDGNRTIELKGRDRDQFVLSRR